MAAWSPVFAAEPSSWLIDPEQFRSSTLLLLTFVALGLIAGVLYFLGVIGAVLGLVGFLVRTGIRTGFRVWERYLSWMPWPVFLAAQVLLLWLGVVAGPLPVITVVVAVVPLVVGLVACLAYMFIDLERYEVARGYKALHNPLMGQRLANELARHGHRVGVPLLGSAAVGMIGGFALLNFGLFRLLGDGWYSPPDGDPLYGDFLASAVVHLLSVVDLLNLANTNHLARVVFPRPTNPVAAAFLALFKSFFTVVLLQQIFASVRRGKLMAETIADFWSPHEPIHLRARAALPQYGAGALGPLLFSLRQTETLTREQRDQLPLVLATIGPAAIPTLIARLKDPNEHVRAVAVATLGRLRAPGAMPRMIALTRDPSDLVRLSLAQTLGEVLEARHDDTPRGGRRRTVSFWGLLVGWRRFFFPTVTPSSRAVQALRSALADPAAAVRAAASGALGLSGPGFVAEVTPDLLRMLDDADETVRARAADSLGRIGATDPAVVTALTGLLADTSSAIKVAAARSLGMLRSAAAPAVPALVTLFQDADEAVREAAAEAVGQIGTVPGHATATLAEGLTSEDNMVRARTAEALGTVGVAAADAASVLVVAAGDTNDLVRAKAVEALGKIGEAAAGVAVPQLMLALRDPDNWVSALAAEALGEMGTAAGEAVPALTRSLTTGNPLVRANAAEALGKLGPAGRPATAALERAATDEDAAVRAKAVRALGDIGPPTAATVGVVRAALADPDPPTRAAAAEAFGEWGHADVVVCDELIALLGDANDEVKARTMQVLPRLAGGTPEVVDALIRRLSADDSDEVRAGAAGALGRCGPAAIPAGAALVRAAQTGGAALRGEAMRALAVIQPPEAVAAFTSGMRDAEPAVRVVASAGWRKATAIPTDAVPVLVESLYDPETQVRANAAHALGRLDPAPVEAVAPLAECVLSADVGLRMNAALALQAIPGAAADNALHPLLADPNPRLRLIAARRLIRDEPTDAEAAAAIAAALIGSDPTVRQSAFALLETGAGAAAVLTTLRVTPPANADPETTARHAEVVGRVEEIVGRLVNVPEEIVPFTSVETAAAAASA
jgi:HEAT repeat protein